MFHKDGTSTSGGKKDAPLRKSDRRKLRDRVLEALFISGGGGNGGATPKTQTDTNGNVNDVNNPQWMERANQLIDDATLASKGGDILSRKLKLPSGELATLFLRTPSPSPSLSSEITIPANNNNNAPTLQELCNFYPTSWPYFQSTQPILLEYEDVDRKVHLIPLLPLLAALPPPTIPSTPPLASSHNNNESIRDDKEGNSKHNFMTTYYRIPNIQIHPQVSKYICRGADLMKSGMRSFPSSWALRQSKGLVSISVIGNPGICAIGFVERSLFRDYCYGKNNNNNNSASDLVGPGTKGIGVTIVNCYGDDLWKSSLSSKASQDGVGVFHPCGGGKYDDGNFGNVGFVEGKFVYPLQSVGINDDDDDDSSDEDDGGDGEEHVVGNNNIDAEDQVEESDVAKGVEEMQLNEGRDDTAPTATEAKKDNAVDANINPNQAAPEPSQDEILSKAFFTSLLQLLSTKTPLPIPVSTYFAKHLISAIPSSGPRLDMKQTTYKKIGPFLLDMESKGIIKLGASKDGKDRCAFLVGIVKQHPELIDFKRQFKKEIESSGGDASAILSAGSATKKKMAVVDLFIIPRHISDGMQLDRDEVMAVNAKTEERKGTGFLTKMECRALIDGYIEKEDLVDPMKKGCIVVNGPLCDALYRISKKDKKQQQQSANSTESSNYPTSVKRKDLIDRWMERMEKGHALVEMPGSKILHLSRGEANPVLIEVEFRQGNRKKFLTRVRGMEEYGIDAESLSNDVSNRFACSSTIETNPVGRPALKKGRSELVFQGHLSEELTALLTGDEKLSSHGGAKGSEYALPKNVIKVELRKGVPARKKR